MAKDAEHDVYGVKAVAQITGIPANTIRAWERRYGACTPSRDSVGRRCYSADQVTRLQLLKHLVEAGHSIGRIAGASTSVLQDLAAEARGTPATIPNLADGIHARILDAANRYDLQECDRLIGAALVALPPVECVRQVLSPLMVAVGEGWECRALTVGQEHSLTAIVKRLTLSVMNTYQSISREPQLAFGTLGGERHELGSLFAAFVAAGHGHRINYFGPDLPAEDFADAVQRIRPHAAGISLVHETEHGAVEIEAFGRMIPRGVGIWAGGPALPIYADLLPARSKKFNAIEDFDLHLKLISGKRSVRDL